MSGKFSGKYWDSVYHLAELVAVGENTITEVSFDIHRAIDEIKAEKLKDAKRDEVKHD